MHIKRLFIGTFIDKSQIESIYEKIREDFSSACSGKWVELENLHFTYQFLGDVQENQIPSIKKDLSEYLITYHSKLKIAGLGTFPSPTKPRVLFVKVHNNEGILLSVHKKMDDILIHYGFEIENRKYTPHVTLRRIKQSNPNEFKKILEIYSQFEVGTMQNFEINLIESILTPKGPIYKKI